MKYSIIGIIVLIAFSCSSNEKPSGGTIEHYSENAGEIVAKETEIEIIAEGFSWSEGPLWIEEINSLVFSDVPENKIFQWNEENGLSLYLEGSGSSIDAELANERGSNGLAMDRDGNLILTQHGNRMVAKMTSNVKNPSTEYDVLADNYSGNTFNSPNDLTIGSEGDIYFTDPPYGLYQQDEDPLKELPYNGVYRIGADTLILLVDSLTRPNGIALSPDESRLYVANSDPANAFWAVYELDSVGDVISGKVFYDVTDRVGSAEGLPDGMKVRPDGIIFATGPGGVFVFSENGELMALINTDGFASNCAFNTDYNMLYMTVNNRIMRVAVGEYLN